MIRHVLEIIGLGPGVEQVYECLLDARPRTAPEIATATELSPGRVRSALRQLEARGLVQRSPGPPPAYAAIDPGIALEVVLLKREEQLGLARAKAREISERFRHLLAGRDPAALVEVITGREVIMQRADQVQRAARHELRALDKPPYHEDSTDLNLAEIDFLRRGGRARAVYESSAVQVPHRMPVLTTYLEAGEEARVLPHVPIKLILVDDQLAMMPLRPGTSESPSPSFVILHRSALLDALDALFEMLWQAALPFVAAEGGVDDGRPLERRILALMNAGLPDEAIARQLGLSHRTLQRRIRELMGWLHAHTRFQLGAQAAARGLVRGADGRTPAAASDADAVDR